MFSRLVPILLSISIHAAREGGDPSRQPRKISCRISIHAAREGGDPQYWHGAGVTAISIHAAREGGDMPIYAPLHRYRHFNPRRP